VAREEYFLINNLSTQTPKKICFNKDTTSWWSTLTALLLLLFAFKTLSVALTTPFSFDGAIFAQVAQNLSSSLTYTTANFSD